MQKTAAAAQTTSYDCTLGPDAKHNLYHLLLKLKVCTMYNTFYFRVRTFCKSNKVHLKMFCALKIHFRVHDTSDTFIIVAKYHLQRQYKTKVSLSFFAFCLLIKQN